MIYDLENNIPKLDPKCWVASNAIIIGKVELKKELILLKKLHESKERQLELLEKIEEIDQFITEHKIQK